jgi:oligopeptide transport system substrate-binding protein
MKKYYIIALAIACGSLLVSCGDSGKKGSSEEMPKDAKGDRYYGGVFKLNEPEYFKNLFPHSITDAVSHRIASQVYEGLLKFNQEDLTLKMGLADTMIVSEDGLTYTFQLKKGVYFHNDECFGGNGREMTAEDIKYCFELLCKPSANNQGFYIFKDKLEGANEYYASNGKGSVTGIKVNDKYSITLKLTQPSSVFKYYLANPAMYIFPREAYEKYGLEMRTKAIGTGPFYISSVEENSSVILKRNNNYYGVDKFGNRLPFLEAISILFIKDKKTELFEFKKGNLDMIFRLPTEHIIEILEGTSTNEKGEYSQYNLQRKPEMATQFFAFQLNNPIFKNINVRKAFNFAIDREKILDFVLNGEGYAPGTNGITPPTFTGYNTDSIKGYTLNIDSARYYLAKAGYPNGKGFPKVTLDLNSGGERNTNVAIEAQKQLKDNLNIDVELNPMPFAQLVENLMTAKSTFFRYAWNADYPSAENFLWLFYGKNVPASMEEKSYPNLSRYINPKFDQYYEAGLKSSTIEEANRNFMIAEKILMADAPVIVLWYDESYRLLQGSVKNFPNNPMQYRDFSDVYIEPKK